MRDTKFTIVKALAIILVVLSHAGASGWLSNCIYLFHVPVFFICAGYFFNTRYLSDERTFLVRRIKGLYLPFVRWSLFFLIFHNIFYYCGILSGSYGNGAGGVAKLYTWHDFAQNAWSIVCNMSGYDPFLGGAFWFFRALLLASIGFLIIFKILKLSSRFSDDRHAALGLLATGLLLTTWLTAGSLRMTGVAQGGYRELMGMTFMAIGFAIRQYRLLSYNTWQVALPALLVLLLFTFACPTSMQPRPTFAQFIALPLPAVAGFLVIHYAATWLDRLSGGVKKMLLLIGDNTLYIFAFHLLAFKIVSALKVAWYDLPWQATGSHPIIHQPANTWLFTLLYLLVGVALPLLCITAYRRWVPQVNIDWQKVFTTLLAALLWLCRFTWKMCHRLARSIVSGCRSALNAAKNILAASNPKDE